MRSALAGHKAIAQFNDEQKLAENDRLQAKFGIHIGPSIIVTLNERLDYFGQTVNIASRVVDLAQGHGIAFTQPIQDEPDAVKLLADYAVETTHTPIKGLDDHLTVNRINVLA